ncbi:hypothetical protein RMATCC62417_14703 [Rhizopus microsporus]|nr:hypothetical protein RMATCC62417_14703 [Rhizopus microsporus]
MSPIFSFSSSSFTIIYRSKEIILSKIKHSIEDTSMPSSHSSSSSCDGQHYFQKGNYYLFGRKGYPVNQEKAIHYYTLAATECNHVQAEGIIGFCYEFGLGLPKDFVEAERRYLAAASKGDGLSMARLAFLRKYGRPNVRINRVEAEEWAEKVKQCPNAVDWIVQAATLDADPSAQYALGVCYHDGVGMPKDEKAAFRWYKASAEQGHARGQGILGYCYGEGFGVAKDELEAMRVEKNEQEAVKWYRRSAERGNIFAYHSLGYCYQNGVGVPINEEEAVFWYMLSAKDNHAPAQLSLGYCYRNGIGVPKNEREAIKWFRKSAEQGNALAQNSLGFCYEEGLGVKKDCPRAVYWYHKSARQGNPWAQCNLGFCYANGIGVQQNNEKAVYWYKLAAAQNHARALDKLGLHLQSGLGVEKNLESAFKSFLKSAEQDHVAAQYHLANCYEKGLGCEVDLAKATAWFEKAAIAGCRSSHERLRRLLVRACLVSPGSTPLTSDDDLTCTEFICGYSAPAA